MSFDSMANNGPYDMLIRIYAYHTTTYTCIWLGIHGRYLIEETIKNQIQKSGQMQK